MRILAFVLLLAACDKAADLDRLKVEPKHPPTPTPTPAPKPTPKDDPGPPATSCETVVISLVAQGTWVGSPPSIRCFGTRKAGALDFEWLEAELSGLRSALAPTCTPGIEIGAESSSKYQEIIATMDSAMKAGFKDVGISHPDKLAMTFDTPPTSSTNCAPPKPVAVPVTPTTPKPGDPDALENAPVIIVSSDEISIVIKTRNQKLVTVADAAKGTGSIPELAQALGTATNGMAILQADQSTPANVLNRIIETTKANGYDNLMFAIKNR